MNHDMIPFYLADRAMEERYPGHPELEEPECVKDDVPYETDIDPDNNCTVRK